MSRSVTHARDQQRRPKVVAVGEYASRPINSPVEPMNGSLRQGGKRSQQRFHGVSLVFVGCGFEQRCGQKIHGGDDSRRAREKAADALCCWLRNRGCVGSLSSTYRRERKRAAPKRRSTFRVQPEITAVVR